MLRQSTQESAGAHDLYKETESFQENVRRSFLAANPIGTNGAGGGLHFAFIYALKLTRESFNIHPGM